jgi:uncharacterized membrane protein
MLMAAIFVFLFIIICIFAGFGIFLYRRLVGSAKQGQTAARLPFKLKYIIAPLAFLVITIIVALVYYGKLPFQVPYHFDNVGAPDGWILPQFALMIGIGIQVIFVIISFFIIQATRRMAALISAGESTIKPDTIVTVTGNIPAFLQLILLFLMADIFHNAVYYTHLLPMWVFLVIIIVLATIAFIAFSVFIAVRALKQSNKP